MRGGRTRKAKIRESPDDGDPASMRRRPTKQLVTAAFDIVRTVGLALPDVEATTKYDGSPVLKVDGMFMAGLATHPIRGTRHARSQSRDRGPRKARAGCARDVLPHGLLSKLSLGAGPSVARRTRRSARLALRVMAYDDGEGTKTPPAAGILRIDGSA